MREKGQFYWGKYLWRGRDPVGMTRDYSIKSARAGAQSTAAGKNLTASVQANGDVRLLVANPNQNVMTDGVVAYATFTLASPFSVSPVTPKACVSADANG